MSEIIYGRKPVIEALKAGRKFEKIYILHGAGGGVIEQIKSLARKSGIPSSVISPAKFKEISSTERAQGVAAVTVEKEYLDIDDLIESIGEKAGESDLPENLPFLLILDGITDPYNLGALIRSAECSGAQGIIIPVHNSAGVTATVVKTSAGASEHLPIARVTNLSNTIDKLKKEGFWVIGTESGAGVRYDRADYKSPIVLVIGSEGKGIRRLVKEKCDIMVDIPLKGNLNSLNASVAGGIVMFEIMRQREGW